MVVRPVVEVIHLDALQHCHRVTTSLVGGAIVAIQLAGPAPSVDPAATHPRLLAVSEALVSIPDAAQVMLARLEERPQQTQRLRAEILGFIDDHG